MNRLIPKRSKNDRHGSTDKVGAPFYGVLEIKFHSFNDSESTAKVRELCTLCHLCLCSALSDASLSNISLSVCALRLSLLHVRPYMASPAVMCAQMLIE